MHLLYAVCHLSVKQYKQKGFNEIQKNPTAGSVRRAYFRNFENGYYGNRNYELEHIYNTI